MKEGLAAAAQREKLGLVQAIARTSGEFAAVQKTVQPVTGKFRDHDGVHEHGDDSDECDVQAFVSHGLLRSSRSTSKVKNDSFVVMNLRSAEVELKRQGTPKRRERRMSHLVAACCAGRVEKKALRG
jgi:hypothetical protein